MAVHGKVIIVSFEFEGAERETVEQLLLDLGLKWDSLCVNFRDGRVAVGVVRAEGHSRDFLDRRLPMRVQSLGLKGFQLEKRKSSKAMQAVLFGAVQQPMHPKEPPGVGYPGTSVGVSGEGLLRSNNRVTVSEAENHETRLLDKYARLVDRLERDCEGFERLIERLNDALSRLSDSGVGRSDSVKSDIVKSDSIKSDSIKSDSLKLKSDIVKSDSIKSDSLKLKSDNLKSDIVKSDSVMPGASPPILQGKRNRGCTGADSLYDDAVRAAGEGQTFRAFSRARSIYKKRLSKEDIQRIKALFPN